jgi:hypothetical protein
MDEMTCTDIFSIASAITATKNTEAYELVIDISTGKY